ncbi:unnamed protein product [Rotaria sp. Silwood1]|nr:unnamed protein product [Rotaria sp. Silwood1]CAF1686015.1 unnamed protein product [Rotaria sp. Silwood1]
MAINVDDKKVLNEFQKQLLLKELELKFELEKQKLIEETKSQRFQELEETKRQQLLELEETKRKRELEQITQAEETKRQRIHEMEEKND